MICSISYHTYSWYMSELYWFGFIAELLNKKWWSSNQSSERACTDHYIPGTYQVSTCHILWSASLLAFWVPHWQALLQVSDRDCLLIISVFATESPATWGWGLPKFHNQLLTSQTWLPLCDLRPWLSAHPNLKACSCHAMYLVLNGWGYVAIKE